MRHVSACKKLPFLSYAMPVIIPESNLPLVAMQLQRTLKNDLEFVCQFMTEDKNKKSMQSDLPGSVTTHDNKLEMVYTFINNYLKTDKVVFHKDFVVAVSESVETTSGICVKKEFERQLRDFTRIKKYKNTQDGSQQCVFFFNGKGSGQTDDLVMSLLIGILMHKRFWSKEKYEGVRNL